MNFVETLFAFNFAAPAFIRATALDRLGLFFLEGEERPGAATLIMLFVGL